MRVHLVALLAVLVLVTAGCITGGEPLDEAEDPEPQGGDEPANETSDGAEDEPSSDEGSAEEPDEDDDSDADRNASAESTNASEEEQTREPPAWPSPENATIRPGVQVSAGGQCTSNFLFRTPDNATLMLGTAAHCVAEASTMGTDGCGDDVEPMAPGAQVSIEGASEPGRLVYSSWHAMQEANVSSQEPVCQANDFALIAIQPADRGRAHPAVLGFGGPTGLAEASSPGLGDRIEWWGNTSATPSSEATNRHQGTVLSSTDWRFQAYSASPGVPGDSGSGIMLEDGQAAGVLYSVNTVYPGANSATKLAPALAFAADHGVQAELVTWPQPGSDPLD